MAHVPSMFPIWILCPHLPCGKQEACPALLIVVPGGPSSAGCTSFGAACSCPGAGCSSPGVGCSGPGVSGPGVGCFCGCHGRASPNGQLAHLCCLLQLQRLRLPMTGRVAPPEDHFYQVGRSSHGSIHRACIGPHLVYVCLVHPFQPMTCNRIHLHPYGEIMAALHGAAMIGP